MWSRVGVIAWCNLKNRAWQYICDMRKCCLHFRDFKMWVTAQSSSRFCKSRLFLHFWFVMFYCLMSKCVSHLLYDNFEKPVDKNLHDLYIDGALATFAGDIRSCSKLQTSPNGAGHYPSTSSKAQWNKIGSCQYNSDRGQNLLTKNQQLTSVEFTRWLPNSFLCHGDWCWEILQIAKQSTR